MTYDELIVNRLHETTDASVWAREFNAVYGQRYTGCELDEGWLIGWFANAIEVGRMAGEKAKAEGRVSLPKEPPERWFRPFIMCPADEVLIAWTAFLHIAKSLEEKS